MLKGFSHLFNFKGLFWKIFLSVWLTSLAIMFITTFIVLHSVESSLHAERVKNTIIKQAQMRINAYELAPEKFNHQQQLRHENKLRRQTKPANKEHRGRLQIYHKGSLIFGRHEKPIKHVLEHEIISASGKNYLVKLALPNSHFLHGAMQRLNFIQLIFIFLGSTLVSILLTWMITKPVKQLSEYSKAIANGKNVHGLDVKLLARGDEFGDLSRDFNHMVAQLERNIASKRQLLHDVSHELRAPLARLQTAAALIEQSSELTNEAKKGEKQYNKYTQLIQKESENIDSLIYRIMDFARLDDSLVIKKEETDLHALCLSVIADLEFIYPDHSFNLKAPSKPLFLNCDKQLINSCLANILQNACKYSPSDKAITVYFKEKKDEVSIHIQDQGKGLAEHELKQLCQPFYRAGNKMHSDGFGLGLSIAKRIMEMHQGEISLSNSNNAGLLVSLRFPR